MNMTIRLEADFENDLRNYARVWLERTWGVEARSIAQKDVLRRFFDAQRRLPSQRPRAVLIADTFSCPVGDQVGLDSFLEKVCKGDDIQPHISTKHAQYNNQDGLLDDWGIHHFHVGIGPHPKKQKFTVRSASLLFALVRDDVLCAIGMYTHGNWTNTEVLETLHRNWPDLISQFRVSGIAAEPLTDMQRTNIRKYNGNVITQVQDGTVYFSLSGGITPAGTSMQAVMLARQDVAYVQQLQASLPSYLHLVMPTLRKNGYKEDSPLRAQLIFVNQTCRILFPDYFTFAM